MPIWKPSRKKWRRYQEQLRAIQKCDFYWIWATVSKVMGIYVKFGLFYHNHSPNMVMSRDSSYKFRKFLTLA